MILACLQAMSKPTPQQERVALRRSLYVPRDRFLFGGVLEKDENKIWLPDNFWIWNQQGNWQIFVMIELGVSWRLTINYFLILKARCICFTSVLLVGGPCTKAPANARRSIELLEFSWVGLWKTARWRVVVSPKSTWMISYILYVYIYIFIWAYNSLERRWLTIPMFHFKKLLDVQPQRLPGKTSCRHRPGACHLVSLSNLFFWKAKICPNMIGFIYHQHVIIILQNVFFQHLTISCISSIQISHISIPFIVNQFQSYLTS